MIHRFAAGLLLLSTVTFAETHRPQDFLGKIAGKPNEGEAIVTHYCATCHAENPQISLGAPKMRAESDWKPRLNAGIEQLLKHTEEGINAMPPMGGCFECSEEQLIKAVLELLPPSERSKINSEMKK